MQGPPAKVVAGFTLLVKCGSMYGYLPEPENSFAIGKTTALAQNSFESAFLNAVKKDSSSNYNTQENDPIAKNCNRNIK